jgi:hypothetical protein
LTPVRKRVESSFSEIRLRCRHCRRRRRVRGAQYASLHPTAIGQKIEIIIEHFRRHVMKGIGGQAKAMKRRLSEAPDVTERFYTVGVDLLDEFDHHGPFRLVGMIAYDLLGIDDRVQLDLFSTSARQRRLDVAIDELAERFGSDVVYRADDLSKPSRVGSAATLDFLDNRTRG